MLTIKLPIINKINITNYMKQYTNVSRFAYNRLLEGKSLSETEKIVKSTMNNIELMNADFIKVAVNQVKNLINKKEKVVFGGKKNWQNYNSNKITKEEYNKNKLLPIMVRGTFHDKGGNRKFKLDIDNNHIIFKPKRNEEIIAKIPNTKQNKLLKNLQILCELGKTYFTCKMSNEFVWITYDENVFSDKKYKPIRQRVCAIDLNPNYIALVVRDKNKIIHKEIIGLYNLNKQNTNKKKHEDVEICKRLVTIAKHYKCEYFIYEKLNIESGDKGKGKNYNRMCNSWRRGIYVEKIQKWCNLYGIKHQGIIPQYSSFVGQIDNPGEFDSIAAAIEMSRRGLLFIRKYCYGEQVEFDFKLKREISLDLVDHWKKKLNLEDISTYGKLYFQIKKARNDYRNLFQFNWFSLRMSSWKSFVSIYLFNKRQ